MLRDNRPRPPKPIRPMPTNPKPTLEMFRLPVFRVHYQALEGYIKRIFGFEFDFLMASGAAPNMGVDYDVVAKVPESYDWGRRAADLRAGNRTREIRLILAVLAQDGYIPAGHYTVSTHPLPDPVVEYRRLLQQFGNPDAPACVAYRTERRDDKAFMSKAAVLDKVMTEAKNP